MSTGERAPRRTQKRFVEGVDFYMEAGKLVFTSTYHLKRGYCCHSRCRHCPYGTFGPHVPSPELGSAASVVIVPVGGGSGSGSGSR